MRLLPLHVAFAAVLAASSVACGGSPETSEKTAAVASAIQGGEQDTNATDNYAVGVANRYGGICSGTLIAPNLVLTARHCVIPPNDKAGAVSCGDQFPKNVAPSYLYVTTEANLYRAKNYYEAAEIITPADASFCGNDIALVMLQKNIPADQATPVTPVVQFAMTDARISKAIAAIGFGVTNPSTDDSGQRRIRENIAITCVEGDSRYDCAHNSMSGDMIGSAEFVTEGFVCSGDSGSGAFDQTAFSKGQPLVLGTLSRGPQTQDKCLSAIYTRTDAHAAMIIDAGLRAAEKGGYAAAPWATPKDAPPAEGVECQGTICTDTSATEPGGSGSTTTTTSSGCSTSKTGAKTGGGAVGLAIALGLLVARRRRAA